MRSMRTLKVLLGVLAVAAMLMLAMTGVPGTKDSIVLCASSSDNERKTVDVPHGEVERGRYLALVGNCNACHTVQDGKPYAGGVAFVSDFGTIYSTNITQDLRCGIGAWSSGDFIKAMREGVRPDGTHLYPAFPFTSFTNLTDQDLKALFAFLQTIPAQDVPSLPNQLKFPYSQRALLGVWKALFFDPQPLQLDSWSSPAIARGAYLVQGAGHCGACHTPRNFLGAENPELFLTGGLITDENIYGDVRPWSAANLTAAPAGLGAWTTDDLISYLKTGLSQRATTFGPMNKVIIDSTRHWTDADIEAVALYLKALPAIEQPATPASSNEVLGRGESVYDTHCGTCHLPTGLGAHNLGPSLVGSAVVNTPHPATLINTILYGPQLPPAPFKSPRRKMTPFEDDLDDEDIAAVASYVRASWGNSASAVSEADVAAQR